MLLPSSSRFSLFTQILSIIPAQSFMNGGQGGITAQKSVNTSSRSVAPDHCSICLEPISERAITAPCNHALFDYLCLLTWLLEQDANCPLCKGAIVIYDPPTDFDIGKTEVTAVSHDFVSAHDFKTFRIPPRSVASKGNHPSVRSARHGHRRRTSTSPPPIDPALAFRKYVYRHQLYSLHMGANRISHFRNFTPKDFASSPEMQSKAKKWIRRELRVFDFLRKSSDTTRTLTNAEYLLEYIMAMLRNVDIKDSSGKPEHLLREFLGQNTPLFLHELEAWLRSPYDDMSDWDDVVQYGHGQ